MTHLTQRITRIPGSPTIALTTKTNLLKSQGIDIIGLGAGEPDFDTPDFVKQAAIKAINNGQTKYTAVEGTLELRKAIQHKFKNENNLDYNPNQILVSVGAKHSIYNLIQVLLQKGDEALIPVPYWVSYPAMVELADATPVVINTTKQDNFKVTADTLSKHITDKTKLLILNSPSNPSGKVYTKQELVDLAEVLLKYPNVHVLSDDIYEHIVWPEFKFYNILTACQDVLSAEDYNKLYNRTIVVNGVSKSYSMTGWRIGYAAGSKELIDAMQKLQSQCTSNPCSIAQAAACEALTNPKTSEFINMMSGEFKKRHDYVYQAINNIKLLSVLPAEGSFYSFVDCSEAIKHIGCKDDYEFSELLLEKANVALVAGSSFGSPNYLRLSYATSMKNLEGAISRIEKFLNNS